MYSQPVYDRAREIFEEMAARGSFIQDDSPCYYIYTLTMGGRPQTGLVGCASIDDYLNNRINWTRKQVYNISSKSGLRKITVL